ncbi:MAG: carbohydrate ABC transporter permease [Acetobacteraceae bacterium]
MAERAASLPLPRRRARTFVRRRRDWTPDLLTAPALIVMALVMGYPLLYLGYMSLHRWSLIGFAAPRFIGLQNFAALVDDDRFTGSLWRTLYFTALGLASNLPAGLGIALLLDQRFPTRNLLRALLILPMVATPAAMGLVWVVMLDPSLGIVRFLFRLIGIATPPLWLSSPAWVVPTLVMVDAWMWTPMVALICMAGLAALPPEPFEAARVDGAGAWQRFRFITFPLLTPALLVAAMLRLMDLLKVIDIIYVMTGGGPGHTSETINLYNYLVALSYDRIGYGSAIALVLFALVLVCTLALIHLRRQATA